MQALHYKWSVRAQLLLLGTSAWEQNAFLKFYFCPKQAQSQAHLYPEFYLVYMEGGMTKLMDTTYIYNLLCTVQKWISELELRVVQATRLRSGTF